MCVRAFHHICTFVRPACIIHLVVRILKALILGPVCNRCKSVCGAYSSLVPHSRNTLQDTGILLHNTATHCSTLQHTATHYIKLQHTATHCLPIERATTSTHAAGTATHCNITATSLQPHCNTLQHTATHYNTLQHNASHCNTLHHAATHCNTLLTHRA